MMNIDPGLLDALDPVLDDRLAIGVRAVVPSRLVGNGLGRPVQMWDADLSVTAATAQRWGLDGLRLGDLVGITDLDVRHNIGFRRGWSTVGITVHGASPLPGHGPGVMPILCGPTESFDLLVDADEHRGVTGDRLQFGRESPVSHVGHAWVAPRAPVVAGLGAPGAATAHPEQRAWRRDPARGGQPGVRDGRQPDHHPGRPRPARPGRPRRDQPPPAQRRHPDVVRGDRRRLLRPVRPGGGCTAGGGRRGSGRTGGRPADGGRSDGRGGRIRRPGRAGRSGHRIPRVHRRGVREAAAGRALR